MSSPDSYDAIVVGSGLGGLSAASALARLGNKKVLVLERHVVAGGYTHVFKRPGGYEWDVGLHYTGQMGPGGQMRMFTDYLSDGALKWQRMQDPFDQYVYPGFSYNAYGDRQRSIAELTSLFPEEEKAIRRYFKDILFMERWTVLKVLEGAMVSPLKPFIRLLKKIGQKRAESYTQEYLDKHFKDPQLKALLCSNFAAFALPPVISDAGVVNAYSKLLPGATLPLPLNKATPHIPEWGITALYLGLKENPSKLGIHGQNIIFLNSKDLDKTVANSGCIEGMAECGFFSFPSMKTPGSTAHTAEIFWFVNVEEFKQWQDSKWKKRGEDYEALKQKIGQGFLDLIEKHYPGFFQLVETTELSTPLTYHHFVGQPNGSPYGLNMSPARLKEKSLGIRSPIKNLYFTGADTLMVGIAPAFAMGALAAGTALGKFGITRLFWAMIKDRMQRMKHYREFQHDMADVSGEI